MKHFFRTLAGKTILFVTCLLCAAILAACLYSVFRFSQDDFSIYEMTEEEVYERAIYKLHVMGGVDSRPEIDAKKELIRQQVHIVYSLRYAVYFIGLGAILLGIAAFVGLMYVSGRQPGTEEFSQGPLFKVPFDVMILGCIVLCALVVRLTDCFSLASEPIWDISCCVIVANILLGLLMSAASRIKQHVFLKNTLIYKALSALFSGLKLTAKGVLLIAVLSALELAALLLMNARAAIILLWGLEKLITVPFIIYGLLQLRKLQNAGEALAEGDLAYQTDTNGMFGELKAHGESLNRIGHGMSVAVEQRLLSERTKTTLITNVSHDIKTPLTSIINYASLIGEETCENEKITEYSEVLVRQSGKLKSLLEDLVEVSKAASGSLEVALAPCDAATFLTQASGEYEGKMAAAGLTLVTGRPEQELRIMADGRRMWRVFDNLLGNAVKYALPGTRVFLTLEAADQNAVITFKNTSREPLAMTVEELTERFTRGDSSRNTEGHGLGLSIAQSLTELQGGTMNLFVDGDLFKAVLSFPLIQ